MKDASNIKVILYSLLGLYFVSEVKGAQTDLLTYAYTCDRRNGYCYHAFDDTVTYIEAWDRCHAIGMHLAMPKTQTQIDFIRNNITGTKDHYHLWMGLTDTVTETEFVWQDQQPLTETASWWTGEEPHDSRENDEDCVEIQEFGWNNAQCTALNRFICETRIKPILMECSKGSPYTFGDKCYQIITGEYSISMSRCQDLGGQLAMPKTTAINNFIHSINYGDEKLWIGIYGSLQALKWLDGDDLTAEQLTNFVVPPVNTREEGMHTAHTTTNGKWIYLEKNDTSKLSYVCEYSFPESAGPTDVCTTPNICTTPDVCLYPESGINANVNVTSLSEGSISVYTCLPGYLLVAGSLLRACVSGANGLAWNGSAPECQVICPEPDENVNTNFVMSSTLYVLGTTVTYSCDEGFELTSGDFARVCHDEGLWTGNTPNCTAVTTTPDVCPCPESGINANVNVMSLSEGSVSVYTCLPGYSLVAGNLSRVCVSGGDVLAWNGSVPKCQVLCTEPDVNANSNYVMSSNLYVLGTTATYSCNGGFKHTSEDVARVCHGVGLWTGKAPNCTATATTPCAFFQSCVVSISEAAHIAEEIVVKLTVPAKSTGKYQRTLISVGDERLSSFYTGTFLASLVCTGVAALIVIPDLLRLLRFAARNRRRTNV